MPTIPTPELGQPALDAFRADLAASGDARTHADNRLLTVATLLRQGSVAAGSQGSQQLVQAARDIAVACLGPRRIAEGCIYDEPGAESDLDVFRITADYAGDLGRRRLQAHVLESVCALAPADSLTAGRCHLRRLAVLIHLGDEERAELAITAFTGDVPEHLIELKLRAMILSGAIARSRGNLPAARETYEEIIRLAGDRFTDVRARITNGIGTILAMRGEYSEALQTCWSAFQLVAGSDSRAEIDIFSDLSLVLMNAGYVSAARAAMANLLHRGSGDILYVLLSGYAEASGRLGDRAGVEWATDQLLQLERERFHARLSTQSLLECAFALNAVGESERAAQLLHRVLELSHRHRFHDLVYRAEQTPPVAPRPASLDERSAQIIQQVKEMEPAALPVALAYAG